MATKTPINLLRGWPSPALLPAAALLTASHNVLTNAPLAAQGLLYGPDEGHLPLRQAISTWLQDFYSDATSKWIQGLGQSSPRNIPMSNESVIRHAASRLNNCSLTGKGDEHRIMITGGASQNLGCILTTVIDPLYTRRVWMVAPSYFMVFKIFEDVGFGGRMRSVPEVNRGEDAGPDVEWLRREMSRVDEAEKNKHHDDDAFKSRAKYPRLYRHIIYTVPNFANPSSLTTSLSTREALVRLAREFDALLIGDDVYDMLQWPATEEGRQQKTNLDKAQLPRLVDVDRYLDGGPKDSWGNAVSNGSFSKICGPGCRVGWIEAAENLAFAVSQAGTTKSGGCPSQFTSLLLHDLLITNVLSTHIRKTLHPAYSRRFCLLISAITTHLLPLGVTMPQPDRSIAGGYFVWLTLPEPVRGAELAERALEEEDLVVAKGELFEIPGNEDEGVEGRFPRNIRLCFAWEDEENLTEGVQRLGRVLGRVIEEEKRSERKSTKQGSGNGPALKELC